MNKVTAEEKLKEEEFVAMELMNKEFAAE